MSIDTRYAELAWTPADILTLAPKLTEEEAEQWLAANEKHICDRLSELGWGVIETFLSMDGIDMTYSDAEEPPVWP